MIEGISNQIALFPFLLYRISDFRNSIQFIKIYNHNKTIPFKFKVTINYVTNSELWLKVIKTMKE